MRRLASPLAPVSSRASDVAARQHKPAQATPRQPRGALLPHRGRAISGGIGAVSRSGVVFS